MEYNDESTKKSGNSKFSNKPSKSMLLLIAAIVLVILLVVEVVVLVNSGTGNNNGDPTANPNLSATAENENSTEDSGGKTEAPSDKETNVPVTAPTSVPVTTDVPTAVPSSRPVVKPVNGLMPNGDIAAAKIIDPSQIDYSFLDGVSTDPFADGAKLDNGGRSYDWYPGHVERAADGTVTKKWDRYQSTLDYLKEYNGIYRKDESKNTIVLTFDCGYEFEGNTGKILDTLKAKNIKAIFFVTAEFTDNPANHDLLKRMYNEGHLIGNHTANHKIMPTLSAQEFVSELNYVYKRCKEILGDDFTMAYYRPPQGACNPRDLALAQYLGYNTTFWSFAYGDYNTSNQPDETDALEGMKKKLHPGAVYLLHAVSTTNANVLDEFIDYVVGEDFDIKRIDEA